MYDIHQVKRDDIIRAQHEKIIAETGHPRILARAKGGELFSYLPEEYGVTKSGSGNVIQTWQGYLVGSIFFAAIGVVSAVLITIGLAQGEKDVTPFFYFLPILAFLGLWLFLHYMRKEYKAKRIRRERGIPTPVE